MISKIKKPVSILLSLIMVFSLFTIVPLSASASYWYSDLARGTLIQPEDTFSFEEIGSFKFADYNDPTIIHEVKGSDFSYNQATLSVTDGYYSFGSTKLLPTSVSPGGLLVADYDSTTKMATFGVQNITHSFDETTGTLTIGGSGVVPPNYAFTGSDVYGVVFTQSNLVKHLIIDATDMIAIKQNAFMAYTGGCVLEDVVITSTSSAPLTIENNAIFYEKDSAVTITVNAATLPTVTSCPVDNYSSPVNLIYNVEQPITFNKNALTNPSGYLTVTFPTHCNIFIPAGPQFTDSQLQEEYDMFAEYGDEEFFWRDHSDLVEGTDYVLGDARYEELTPLNASLVVGNYNTALFSAYTITDASVNGAVTASVGGTDVTEAEPDSTVLLTVAPDSGYQFKSITAVGAKYGIEEFSDLVAVMGDAEFEAAEYADRPEHTCKAEDGKFVVYNGTTPVTELSESDITDVSGLSGNSPMITCGNIRWYFGISDGKITSIEAVNTSSWDYLFESANGSESTGTLPPADFALTTVTEGSQYSFTMPKRAVTVTAEFEEAPEPAVASVTVGGTTTEYTDFATAVTNWNSAADGATLTLLADVQMGSPVNVSGTRTLDLNGYGIKVTVVNQTVFNVSGNLTLNDSGATKIHKFDPPSGTAGLATLNEESGSLEIHGGYITGFKGVTRSYLFNVSSGGSFTINGGNLIGNEGTQKVSYNGTVVISASGDLTINGGAIIYNKSGYWGTAISAACTLKINGGTIAHNYASQSTAGIYCWYLEMTGGSVTDNVAATTGQSAGITVERHATFSGNPVIKDNTDSTGASNLNVYMQTKCSAISSNLGENACIGITMSNPGVFTDSSDTSFNDPTKFFSDKSSYAVHKNDAGQLYLSKKLIAGHTLSLDGNIAINFYLDPSAAGLTAADVNSGNLSYSFAWVDQADTKAKVDVAEQARQSQAFTVSDDGKYIIVTCHVCAAEMTCGVNASFTLGNKTESEVYSVRDYGDSVLNPTAEWLAKYKTQYPDNTAKSYNNLVALVTKMLDYGAKAQTVFGINKGYLANKGLSYNMLSDTPDFDEAIQKANDRLADNPASSDFYGENFKAPSLVFLDYSTLKLYFENKDGSLSTSGLTKWNNYYYIKHENIAASQLDTLQTFTVSGKTFRYSALDYAKVLATSANTDNANLAKALYWYNQAANAYFG